MLPEVKFRELQKCFKEDLTNNLSIDSKNRKKIFESAANKNNNL